MFLQEIDNLVLLDQSKTKPEIVKDLKAHFKNNVEPIEQPFKSIFGSSSIIQTQFHNLFNSLFFLL